MGENGGTATMHGPVTVTNDVTAGGKSLMTHTHGGVETGSGNTGEPQ
ncbi:phage baseplate protein, partial [Klebsiella pneumoniae]